MKLFSASVQDAPPMSSRKRGRKVGKQRQHRADINMNRAHSSFLEEPIMTKVTERGEAKVSSRASGRDGNDEGNAKLHKLRYAVSEMQGWRSHMEDDHVLNAKLASNRHEETLLKDHHLFAVFDGHGGDFASKFCGKQLVPVLTSQPDWQAYLALSSDRKRESVRGLTLLKSALTATFLQLDSMLMEAQTKIRQNQLSKLECDMCSLHLGRQDMDERAMNFDRQLISTFPAGVLLERSGSTGVVVLITTSHIICANAGDSRAILSKTTEANVLPLSFDHKPSKDVEVSRVERDGGFVRAGRVDGDLAVARSFGDFGYKNCSEPKDHRVTVHPDIVVYAREPSNDEFLVLACDGIWDRLSNKECADLVHTLVYREGESDVGLICEEIIDTALELDSRDNMTCCVVMFPSIHMDDRSVSLSIPMGVMKLRLDRERLWGENSTPAIRHQQRLDDRRRRYKELLLGSASVEQQKSFETPQAIASSKSQSSQKSSSKKHRTSTAAADPKVGRTSSGSLGLSLKIGRTSSSSSSSRGNK